MNSKFRLFMIAGISVLLMFLILPSAVFAADEEGMPRFIDEEGLLSLEQAETLERKLDEISERHQFDVVAAVVSSLDGREAHRYAADFFEQNGFGRGEDLDGCILLLEPKNRDFGFAAVGFGIEAFTVAGQEYLDKLFVPHLKEEQYYEAFIAYADAADNFLVRAEEGVPYDEGNIPILPAERAEGLRNRIVFSVILAFIISFIITSRWKRQLKSVKKEDSANAYIREGSMVLTGQRDVFLHRNVEQTRRDNNSSNGKSGKSDRSDTSSGRSSSGHSGKF